MSFKDYILNVHPDPDFLGSKTVYDAYDELDRLAQNYAKDQNERLTKESEKDKAALQYYAKVLQEEIQKNDSLTKEVEGLKSAIRSRNILQQEDKDTITRLRELLGETLKWLQWSSHSDAQLLASKIDNALNHKP